MAAPKRMASIFSKIVAGEIPCHKVAETKDFLAFLDIRPFRPGHTLCIPKKEVDYLFDMDDEAYIGLNLFAKQVAKALLKAVPAQRIGTVVIGLEVPHAHIHLLPINSLADMALVADRPEAPAAELAALATKIHSHL